MSRLVLLLAGACVLALCAQYAAAQDDPGLDPEESETPDEILPWEGFEPATMPEGSEQATRPPFSTVDESKEESRNGAVARAAGSKQRALARTAAHARARTAGKARTAAKARTADKEAGRAGAKSARAHHQ